MGQSLWPCRKFRTAVAAVGHRSTEVALDGEDAIADGRCTVERTRVHRHQDLCVHLCSMKPGRSESGTRHPNSASNDTPSARRTSSKENLVKTSDAACSVQCFTNGSCNAANAHLAGPVQFFEETPIPVGPRLPTNHLELCGARLSKEFS